MTKIQVSLLGRFDAACDGQPVAGFDHAKARELFSFLLLHRDKPNSREIIATHLWGGHYTTEVSKKYLRKALWQLNSILANCGEAGCKVVINADSDWLELSSCEALWIDVAVLDQTYEAVKGIPGSHLDTRTIRILRDTVDLYRGDLLEGDYQEWSFYHLVRYRQIALNLYDKLIDHALARGEYEAVLDIGATVLRQDPAREMTHLKMMRAHHGLGDRTGALRQFARCRDILREELDIEPSRDAMELVDLIRSDRVMGELSLIPSHIEHSSSGAGHRAVDDGALLAALGGRPKQLMHPVPRVAEAR